MSDGASQGSPILTIEQQREMSVMMDVRIADSLISLDDVIASAATTVWYSVGTCWWTTNPDHLEQIRVMRGDSKRSIPSDPAGAPLLMTDDVTGFLQSANEHPEHYGRHGINAFMLAYHGNVISADGMPRCSTDWKLYNDLLDQRMSV